MSPELGIVLYVLLLWGPTALWLAYRASRGQPRRVADPPTAETEPRRSSQPAPHELEELASHGFWVCGTCSSLNRPKAKRCYGCRTAAGSAVMQPPGEQPVLQRVPARGYGNARSSGEAPGTPLVIATPGNAAPPPQVLVHGPASIPSPAPPEARSALPACPFIGFRNDPSTRCDFPDPRNLCHAASRRGDTPMGTHRRFLPDVAGGRRPRPIDMGHQGSLCLTATHEQCARYPAGEAVAGNS